MLISTTPPTNPPLPKRTTLYFPVPSAIHHHIALNIPRLARTGRNRSSSLDLSYSSSWLWTDLKPPSASSVRRIENIFHFRDLGGMVFSGGGIAELCPRPINALLSEGKLLHPYQLSSPPNNNPGSSAAPLAPSHVHHRGDEVVTRRLRRDCIHCGNGNTGAHRLLPWPKSVLSWTIGSCRCAIRRRVVSGNYRNSPSET
jgi:hypothetical protein